MMVGETDGHDAGPRLDFHCESIAQAPDGADETVRRRAAAHLEELTQRDGAAVESIRLRKLCVGQLGQQCIRRYQIAEEIWGEGLRLTAERARKTGGLCDAGETGEAGWKTQRSAGHAEKRRVRLVLLGHEERTYPADQRAGSGESQEL